jgi:hypothetical protein
VFADLQFFVVFAISVVVLVATVWGVIDAARFSSQTYVNIGKNKAVWVAILAAAAAISFISLPPPLGRGGGVIGLLGIAAIIAVVFYFVDVRKKLQANQPPRPGPGGTQRGGW